MVIINHDYLTTIDFTGKLTVLHALYKHDIHSLQITTGTMLKFEFKPTANMTTVKTEKVNKL